ncbi:MAG: tRNA dihydrouridine synthase DusB [Bacteroidaceae bacterium]|nr:tRNA dihydrouridine synthase DusB [Bacteroidaceae bacterium]
MKIRDIDLGHRPVMLAPMEDVTDPAFRHICKEFGAAMVYSEFVSADALIRSVGRTMEKIRVSDDERPAAVQIYGRDVETMVEAARIVESEARPDVIDINFGCPVKKVAGKGAGAGLLRNPELLLQITRAVVEAVQVPVTVKTRLGWDHESKNIVTLAEQLQDCGIEALTIHGRTRSQMYTGEADWTLIGEVKKNPRMHIPIIGNGDIDSGERALEMFERYGVDGVMVGRATFGQPWLFREIRDVLDGRTDAPPLTTKWKMDVLRRQIRESVAGSMQRTDCARKATELGGIIHVRRHLAASPLFKGIPDFRQTRIRMLRAESMDELFAILDEAEQRLV